MSSATCLDPNRVTPILLEERLKLSELGRRGSQKWLAQSRVCFLATFYSSLALSTERRLILCPASTLISIILQPLPLAALFASFNQPTSHTAFNFPYA